MAKYKYKYKNFLDAAGESDKINNLLKCLYKEAKARDSDADSSSKNNYELEMGGNEMRKFKLNINSENYLCLISSGLGVGTSVPSTALHISKTLNIIDTSDGYASSDDGYASSDDGYASSDDGYASSDDGYASSDGYTTSNPDLPPDENNALAVAFNNFGLLGYDINRDSMKFKAVYGKNIIFDVGGGFLDDDGSSERMRITYDGKTGISKRNPSAILHIGLPRDEGDDTPPIKIEGIKSGDSNKNLVWDSSTGNIFYKEQEAINLSDLVRKGRAPSYIPFGKRDQLVAPALEELCTTDQSSNNMGWRIPIDCILTHVSIQCDIVDLDFNAESTIELLVYKNGTYSGRSMISIVDDEGSFGDNKEFFNEIHFIAGDTINMLVKIETTGQTFMVRDIAALARILN